MYCDDLVWFGMVDGQFVYVDYFGIGVVIVLDYLYQCGFFCV